MERVEPDHPELTRNLWNSEFYIDEVLLPELKLPINRNYVLYLIDATMVHHVIGLAVQADDAAVNVN